MRYVILAILVYLAYLVLKGVIRGMKDRTNSENSNEKKPPRSYDPNQVQDAEFREVKKDKKRLAKKIDKY
jgi:hypothetical protein